MTKHFRIGSKVQWNWAGGIVEGVVEEIFKETIIKTIKGKKSRDTALLKNLPISLNLYLEISL